MYLSIIILKYVSRLCKYLRLAVAPKTVLFHVDWEFRDGLDFYQATRLTDANQQHVSI